MSREKILIAEDDADVRQVCVRVLNKQDYQVTVVEDGLQAIDAAKQESFDLLLTDIKMPKLDGLETAQAIKALQPDIVCVVMTGFGTMDTAIKALQLGIDEFLVKPFSPDALTTAVAKAMEKVHLRRENIRLRALIPLFELSKTFMSTVAEDELLRRVLEVAQQETRADKACLILWNRDGEQLTTFVDHNFDAEAVLDHELAVELAQISQQRTPPAQQETADFHPQWTHRLAQAGVHAAIVTPLLVKTKPLGALIVAKSHPGDSFAASDPELLSILCGQAAIAIENARLFEEIQKAYEELKELDRLKSEFINIAAHELRTPLAILMGHASLLVEELDGFAGQRMEIIERNAIHLRELINDMLTLRHLESGMARLRPEPCDLAELVATSTSDLQSLAQDKQQTVNIIIEDGMPPVMVDRQRLNLVLSNLFMNATKFTPEGGTITIRGWTKDNEVLISVEDNGIGIPQDEIDKIFERFYQVADSLTREHSGMGLGLAIVRGMVDLWQGRIWVESKVGVGSTFTFSIPQPAAVPA
jgi:signal transduction histidine kinase/CheY-like chemotaxis protein